MKHYTLNIILSNQKTEFIVICKTAVSLPSQMFPLYPGRQMQRNEAAT